ncbi:MAG: DUF1499 domain-containing protein [Pseudomonadota bacterium]
MDQADSNQPRWWSRATLIGGIIALALLVLGPLGTRFGIWGFQFGLMCLFGAVVLAAIGLIVAIFGYLVARRNSLDVDRPVLVTGGVIAALILAVMGVQANAAFSVPPIHNISTDVDDPPVFQRAGALRGVDSNSLDYDAATLAPQQQAAYPDVKPLDSSLAPEAAIARAQTVLEDMGLEIIGTDAGGSSIEATYTSFWFGFKDDVVVRVRPAAGGSRIDVRSVSRVGQSDLGANARRILRILEGMQGG